MRAELDICGSSLLEDGALYGREAQKQALLQAFQSICENEHSTHGTALKPAAFTLITGRSGSGKTVLAKELESEIQLDGFFVTGKYNPLDCTTENYAGLIEAFTDLSQQIVSRGGSCGEWRAKMKDILETEPLIMALVPALATACGISEPSTSVSRLAVGRAHERHVIAFRRLLREIVSTEMPLVMLLDDLQWADRASLNLMMALVTDTKIQGFMLLGTCRHDEVTPNDYLSVVLREMEAQNIRITNIFVDNLDLQATCSLAADMLQLSRNDKNLKQFTLSLHTLTEGNPLFTRQCISTLLEKYPDRQWLQKHQIPHVANYHDNVQLLADKISKLPKSVRDVLVNAACFGNEFYQYALQIVSKDADPAALTKDLAIAERLGYIIRNPSGSYRFRHDQFHQSAYSQISPEDKNEHHLSLGRKLLSELEQDPQISGIDIFVAVNQLRWGVDLITDTDERIKTAHLALLAGEKAAKSSDFQTAASYLNLGIELLNATSGIVPWLAHYDLFLNLYSASVEVAFCNADMDYMNQLIQIILEHARHKLDTVRALTTKIYALGCDEPEKALDLGLQTLNELGMKIPKKVGIIAILRQHLKTKRMLKGLTHNDILSLPAMVDEEKSAIIRILNFLVMYATLMKQEYFPYYSFLMVQLTLEYGMSGVAGFGFAAYSTILCSMFRDFDGGIPYAFLAIKLVKKCNADEWMSRVYSMAYFFSIAWQEHYRALLQPLLLSHRIGLGNGDIEMGVGTGGLYTITATHSYLPLHILLKDAYAFQELQRLHRQHSSTSITYPSTFLIETLLGRTPSADDLASWKSIVGLKNEAALQLMDLTNLIIKVQFYEYKEAEDLAIKLSKWSILEMQPPIVKVMAHFYIALTKLVMFNNDRGRSRLRVAKKSFKKLERYEQIGPMNCSNKVKLLQALFSIGKGKNMDALRKLRESIRQAVQSEFWGEVGIAYEFLYGLSGEAADLDCAIQAYEKWGATAKLVRLRQKQHVPESCISNDKGAGTK